MKQQLVTRAEVAAQIRAWLAGTIDTVTLAGWAFDQFYALELAVGDAETADPELVAALDSLLFLDQAAWQPSHEELRALAARFEQP
ncbi:MAG TPA: hypothetical protein PKA05_01470 [Roseiflexaceae bacterium]|nr:hypothetical protein [Roseiflexaceae bacterium]HMP39027.1 hypothetical protein [Roseiflexaceae bacterium]